MPRRLWALPVLFALACSGRVDTLPRAEASDGGRDAANDGPTECPADMVQSGGFCIDRYEVTGSQYDAFLSAGAFPIPPPYCKWNTNLVPRSGWPAQDPSAPVVAVDWCDSYAYCASMGRRLCGSEWFDICAGPSHQAYPYGDLPRPICNCGPSSSGQATGSQSWPMCEGFVNGLFNMSGNVAEWLDVCEPASGAGDTCRIAGGSFAGSYDDARCDAVREAARIIAQDDVGFRCCLTLAP